MYGIVSEVCENLKSSFPQNEEIMLIIWTTSDVQGVLRDESITEAMAARIPAMTNGTEGQHEYGIGSETLQCIRQTLEEEEALRPITVPAAVLEKVMALAEEFLLYTNLRSGEGTARRLYREEPEALQRVREAVNG